MASRDPFQPLTRTLAALRLQARNLEKREASDPLERLLAWTRRRRHAILFADDAGRFMAANPSGLRLTGFTAHELRRKGVWDITEDTNQAEFEPLWRAFLRTGQQRGGYNLRSKPGFSKRVIYAAEAHVLKGVHVSVLAPAGVRETERPARRRPVPFDRRRRIRE